MKTQTENTGKNRSYSKISRLFLTGCMLISITAGWIMGSFTTQAFSQSKTQQTANDDSTTLLTFPLNGENLPTMLLDEFSVIANKK